MKKNDPNAIMPDVVRRFAGHLSADSRLGIVIFGKGAGLVLPLTEVNRPDFSPLLEKSLANIDYGSLLTDTPAGVERALYELRQKSRPVARRIIVLFTDGIVDVGNTEKGLERERWLRSNLAPNAQQLGIKIFGIAFTEDADFQLMQSVAQSTGGEYFRILRASDIEGLFNQIGGKLGQGFSGETNASSLPAKRKAQPSAESAQSVSRLLLLAGVGFVFLLGIVRMLVRRRKGVSTPIKEEIPVPGPKPSILHPPEPIRPAEMELHAPPSRPQETTLEPVATIIPQPAPPKPVPLPEPAIEPPPPLPGPRMCQKHPAWKATEFCPECASYKCKNCMTEKNGRTICADCAKKLQHR
jgi:hypothetical protein